MTAYLITEPNAHQPSQWAEQLARDDYLTAASKLPGPLKRRWSQRAEDDPRRRTLVEVTYRGGEACNYMVSARGAQGLFHGVTDLHSVMREIHTGERWYWEPDH